MTMEIKSNGEKLILDIKKVIYPDYTYDENQIKNIDHLITKIKPLSTIKKTITKQKKQNGYFDMQLNELLIKSYQKIIKVRLIENKNIVFEYLNKSLNFSEIVKINKRIINSEDNIRTENIFLKDKELNIITGAGTDIKTLNNDLKIIDKILNSKIEPIIKAILIHNEIANIHPFIEGNGRTARVAFNIILLKNNLPSINLKNRKKPTCRYNMLYTSAVKSYINTSSLNKMLKFIEYKYNNCLNDQLIIEGITNG